MAGDGNGRRRLARGGGTLAMHAYFIELQETPGMADDDFTIDSLAAYLHLHPQQVARLADRGQAPGRRIGGEWRFSRPEIHHWLEEKIGISDDAELAQMESVLAPPRGAEPALAIPDLLPLEAIAIPLPSRTRNSVISDMVQLAAATGYLWDPEKMAAAVRSREEMHPTALENGVAFLHPRRPQPNILGQAFIAFGRTSQGIPFGGRTLTDCFFLLLSTDDAEHLRTLARLSRMVGDADFLAELRDAPDARAVQELIAARDAAIS